MMGLKQGGPAAAAGNSRPGDNRKPVSTDHTERGSGASIVHNFVEKYNSACQHLVSAGFHDTAGFTAAVNAHGIGRECLTRPELVNLAAILLLCGEAGISRPGLDLVRDFARENNFLIVGDDKPAELAVLADPLDGPPAPAVLEVHSVHVDYWARQVVNFCRRRMALAKLHKQWLDLLEGGAADAH